ncbi:MAG: chromosome segregation protein SMC [Thiothrix sp.]|nr:MAG: chromosome segregation protein SMC [Thiothrix sp.]
MRLSKIRIAGFKSFVDPVTLNLPSNLVGILGPNGCGKSNTIDAVRWVMGESSAKNLRGQSMDDVIFNGSSARKPVGLASVELVFDNSAGDLAGLYAQYTEIAIKRQVSRDGSSKFFLNGTRCRRRDITDIFLGTGLGPRSYAIIEQGMISRLIEAKPEELRVTLEEAAGISRYKERRRETETRIQHTRENLERLKDLREELEKQLQKLDKQAKTAERFRELRLEQQHLSALNLAAQLQALKQAAQALISQLNQSSHNQQAELKQIQDILESIESLRLAFSQATEALSLAQGHYYAAGSAIGRLEQSIQHQAETKRRQQENLQRLEQTLAETLVHQQADEAQLQSSQTQLAELLPKAALVEEQLIALEESLQQAEHNTLNSQTELYAIQNALVQPTRQLHSETARIEQLERQAQQVEQRLARFQVELDQLKQQDLTRSLQNLALELAAVLEAQTVNQTENQQVTEQLQLQRQQQQQLVHQVSQERSQLQTLQGQLSALNTLQQAALKHDDQAYRDWLQEQQLTDHANLATELVIETGWEQAIETVLAQRLKALCVTDLTSIDLTSLPSTGLSLLELISTNMDLAPNSLAKKIITPVSAQSLVQGALSSSDLATALAERQQLAMHEFYVTPTGICVGQHWLTTPSQQTTGSILERQQTIRALNAQLSQVTSSLDQTENEQQALQVQIQVLEQTQHQAQAEYNRLQRQELELNNHLQQLTQQQRQQEQRTEQLSFELQELAAQQAQQQLELASAYERLAEAEALITQLKAQEDELILLKEQAQRQLQDLRTQVRHWRDQQQQLALSLQSCQSQIQSSQQQLERGRTRLDLLSEQRLQLVAELAQQTEPITELTAALEQAKAERLQYEQALHAARQQTQTIEQQIRTQEQLRLQHERQLDSWREQLEQLKLAWQTNQVQSQHLQEQLAPSGFELASLLEELVSHDPALISERLGKLTANIERLGAINLAAIDEYREQHERKLYLDQQNDDLVLALETLEAAMRKIDRETRARFKETFDLVNQRLQAMFPRLFGGGECYLAMTDTDMLTTGISIMARPPGKRLSSIHLMSGGEKALTAVALVFAIFELNPAPFCMLDEVDAPLDEANVGRFCELVKQMSERVQFIFITHNKTTMELAENLIGVTMREAGVSRLVAVDMAQALQLANE